MVFYYCTGRKRSKVERTAQELGQGCWIICHWLFFDGGDRAAGKSCRNFGTTYLKGFGNPIDVLVNNGWKCTCIDPIQSGDADELGMPWWINVKACYMSQKPIRCPGMCARQIRNGDQHGSICLEKRSVSGEMKCLLRNRKRLSMAITQRNAENWIYESIWDSG